MTTKKSTVILFLDKYLRKCDDYSINVAMLDTKKVFITTNILPWLPWWTSTERDAAIDQQRQHILYENRPPPYDRVGKV